MDKDEWNLVRQFIQSRSETYSPQSLFELMAQLESQREGAFQDILDLLPVELGEQVLAMRAAKANEVLRPERAAGGAAIKGKYRSSAGCEMTPELTAALDDAFAEAEATFPDLTDFHLAGAAADILNRKGLRGACASESRAHTYRQHRKSSA